MHVVQSINARGWISGIFRMKEDADRFVARIPEPARTAHRTDPMPVEDYPLFIVEHQGFRFGDLAFALDQLRQLVPSPDEDQVHFNLYAVTEDFSPTRPGTDCMGRLRHWHVDNEQLEPGSLQVLIGELHLLAAQASAKQAVQALPPSSVGVLSHWLALLSDDPVIHVNGADINDEAIANMWAFSPTDEQTSQLDGPTVARFVEQVISQQSDKLLSQGGPAMTFYCWHDLQARQLRFSMVSSAHGRLPFGCNVVETRNLSTVIEEIVGSDWLKCDRYFERSDYVAAADDSPFTLNVFVTELEGFGRLADAPLRPP